MHWVQVWEWFPKKPSVHLGKSWKLNPTVSLFRFDTTLFFVSTLHSLEVGARCFLPNGPPSYPFFKTVVICDVFYFQETYDKLRVWGRHLTPNPWPYRLITLTTCCWVREKKKPDTPRNGGFGKLIFPLSFGASLPKASHHRLILAKYRGPIELSEFKVTMAATAAILFFPFEDWNCRNMKV